MTYFKQAVRTVHRVGIAIALLIVGLVVALALELHGVAPADRAANLEAVAHVLVGVAEIVKACLRS